VYDVIKNWVPLLLACLWAQCGSSVAAPVSEAQRIDALLAQDWAKHQLKPNAPAADATFVRRVFLDVVGRIPTYRETEEFLSSVDADKRAKLIERLLASEGYVQHFFNFWADILRTQSRAAPSGSTTGTAYVKFIKDSLRANKPYDQFARELIAARGRSWEGGAIGYYMRDRAMPLENMANTVRVFLGTRIECAQCHNHPFDKWTQMQFYQMAAFTYGIETGYHQVGPIKAARQQLNLDEAALRQQMTGAGKNSDAALKAEQETLGKQYRSMQGALNLAGNPLAATTVDWHAAQLRLPHDYQYSDAKPKSVVTPATLMAAPATSGELSPDACAAWMTSPQNPRFTKVIVNRLWKKLFGLALIEPLDELTDVSTPAVPALQAYPVPALQAYLEQLMIAQRFDMKMFLRVLLNSQAYQRCVTTEEHVLGMPYHFTGPILRRMTAEQLWDSFVTLINPAPDCRNALLDEQVEQRLLGARKFNDALEALTPAEMLQGARTVSLIYHEQTVALKSLQLQMDEARKRDDANAIKALSEKAAELQRNTQSAVNDSILIPAVNKLASQQAPNTPAIQKATILGGDVEINMSKVPVPGYGLPREVADRLRLEREAQLAAMHEEIRYFGISVKEAPAYLKFRESQSKTWLRAADIESPSPRGHYLREFGQSDREVIENGSTDASIPQALALMNGEMVPQVLVRYSQVKLAVQKMPQPEQQLQAVYLALLARQPSQRERELWLKAQANGLSTVDDLICALLNTQQFMFIQ